MISYSELEQAIKRWKARKAGNEVAEPAPSPQVMAGPAPEPQKPAEATEAPAAAAAEADAVPEATGEISIGDDLVLDEEEVRS